MNFTTELFLIGNLYFYYTFHISMFMLCYKVCHYTGRNVTNPIQLMGYCYGGSFITSLVWGEVPVLLGDLWSIPLMFLALSLRESGIAKHVALPRWLVMLGSEYCRVSIALAWAHKTHGKCLCLKRATIDVCFTSTMGKSMVNNDSLRGCWWVWCTRR